MERRVYLQIPGPTNIPDRVLRALSRPNLNHRGPEFGAVVQEVVAGLKYVFQTQKGTVLIFPGSGSGAMEAAIVNTLSPGDRVLALRNGHFSHRFAAIAAAFGLQVDHLDWEWGRAVDPDQVRAVLQADQERRIKAILITHNETSTAVTNDLRAVSAVRRELGHPALLLVDAVSSLGCIDLRFDEWELDVVVIGCQKGLMLPPGLAIVAVSERTWEAVERARLPRWYWDFRPARARLAEGLFPYTPAQSLFFGLKEALAMFREEGLQNVFARHRRLAQGIRAGAQALSLKMLADERYASNSVTALYLPAGVSFEALADRLREGYGVIIAGGLGRLEGKIFRIGHLGRLHITDVLAILAALEGALLDLGLPVTPGAAVAAARQAMQD